MKLWLLTIGEPLPEIDGSPRLLRAGLMAEYAAARGHDVTWWTSSFDHSGKYMRESADFTTSVGIKIRLFPGGGYTSNVSVARLLDHSVVAAKILLEARDWDRPDIIVASLPSLELSAAAVWLGKRFSVPVVVDVRDLWPDIFLDVLPPLSRIPARVLLAPWATMARYALSNASAITGITEEFVSWGVARARRPRGLLDQTYPLAYPQSVPTAEAQWASFAFWKSKGVRSNDALVACFFGSLGKQFELDTLLDAAVLLHARNIPVQVVVCGSGEALNDAAPRIAELPNVICPGWVDAAQIWTLLRMSHVGLAPYRTSPSFSMSIPNKVVEYWSAGLPVISSLQGKLAKLLASEQIGFSVPNRDAGGWADALAHCAAAGSTIERMGLRARKLYVEHFTAEVIYEKWIDGLEGLAISAAGRS